MVHRQQMRMGLAIGKASRIVLYRGELATSKLGDTLDVATPVVPQQTIAFAGVYVRGKCGRSEFMFGRRRRGGCSGKCSGRSGWTGRGG